jgi:hypothetical protein
VSDLFNFVGFAGGVILHRRASARGAARISRTSREVDGGIGVAKMHHRWGIERRGKYPSPPFFHRSFYTIALQAPSLNPLPLAVSLSQISRCVRTAFRLLGSEGPHATRTIVTTSWYLLQTFEMRGCLKPTTPTTTARSRRVAFPRTKPCRGWTRVRLQLQIVVGRSHLHQRLASHHRSLSVFPERNVLPSDRARRAHAR